MSLQLILVRHAKSGWDSPLLADHDRPLSARGERSAAAIGRWLAGAGHVPALAVSSTARRTLESWSWISHAFDTEIAVRLEPRLYHAGAEVMLKVLQGCAGSPVLMLGHNPGIAEFAQRLLAASPVHPRFADYPTAATLVARFDAAKWRDVQFGTGAAVDYRIPADLGVTKHGPDT